jgi:hypothetical protein
MSGNPTHQEFIARDLAAAREKRRSLKTRIFASADGLRQREEEKEKTVLSE